jgi:hypothetical protein
LPHCRESKQTIWKHWDPSLNWLVYSGKVFGTVERFWRWKKMASHNYTRLL